MIKNYIYLLLVVVIIVISFIITQFQSSDSIKPYDLQKHGLCVIKNTLSIQEIEILKEICKNEDYKQVKDRIINHPKIIADIIQKTGQGFEFHDYIFILKKSAIHTCHRDANGSMFNDLSNLSYTMILYLEDMDKCLGIIPQSHQNRNQPIYLPNSVQDVVCQKGDILLFDANIIHTGIILETPDNLRIQMKISHKDDISKLSYYTNYNKIMNESNTMPIAVQRMQQTASCMFPIISDYTQTDVKNTTNYQTDSDIPFHQRVFSYLFYGKSNYYNLDNAY